MSIKSDDPKAIEKLEKQLITLEENHKRMKEVNAYYRKHGSCSGCKAITSDEAVKFDNKVRAGRHNVPFPSYQLSYSNADIRRIKGRINELTKKNEVGFIGWDFNGGKAVANAEKVRLQLIFDEKPNEEQRSELKQNGFHWSPTEQAWQRLLNENAIYACRYMKSVRPVNGDDPVKIQPKFPAKDVKER